MGSLGTERPEADMVMGVGKGGLQWQGNRHQAPDEAPGEALCGVRERATG